MFQIVQAPNPVLSKTAKPVLLKTDSVLKIDQKTLDLISEMQKTLEATRDPEGVGLAAPQIGQSLQIFIVKESPKAKVLVFINPVVTLLQKEPELLSEQEDTPKKKKRKQSVKLEGCLSLPTIWGYVARAQSVEITYFDESGTQYTKIINGFLATILQHEYDHLQGILFPKRVLEQKGKLYKSSKNEKGEDEFEEIEI